MKTYRSAPVPEFRIVKPDSGSNSYEVWITRPVCVGSISRFGNGNLVTDDKQRFKNVFYAAQHLLERAKETGLSQAIQTELDYPTRNVTLTGMELLNKGKLQEFLKLRAVEGPIDEGTLRKQYNLNKQEVRELGLDDTNGAAP